MCNPLHKTIVLLLVLLCFAATTVQGATVRPDPLSSSVGLGATFFIDVVGESFPTTEGGGFDLAFDQTVINALSVSIDSGVWSFVNNLGTIDNVTGFLSGVLVSAFPGVALGDFTVATIEFQAVGAGASTLLLSESAINPWASGTSAVNPGFTAGSVTVGAIPLPATLWLFASGLIGIVGLARRK